MQNIKMLAYKFLLEAQFKELNVPIEQLETALEKQDIVLAAYSAIGNFRGSIPDDVLPEILESMRQNNGISVVCDDFTVILYSDDLSYSKKIHTIYHELGHIKAGHKRLGAYRFEENEEQEREAEAFAYYVTAPPCILHEIGGISDGILARLTGLDGISARVAYRLLEEDRQDRLVAIEKRLILQYDGYIKANKESESVENAKLNIANKKRRNLIFGASAAAFVIICVIFGLCIHNSKKQVDTLDITPTPMTAVTTPKSEMPQSENNTEKTGQVVWKARTGDVYHTDPNCYHIPKTAITMDLSDAIAAGYRKCKDCK